jgi:hypothetical protein
LSFICQAAILLDIAVIYLSEEASTLIVPLVVNLADIFVTVEWLAELGFPETLPKGPRV